MYNAPSWIKALHSGNYHVCDICEKTFEKFAKDFIGGGGVFCPNCWENMDIVQTVVNFDDEQLQQFLYKVLTNTECKQQILEVIESKTDEAQGVTLVLLFNVHESYFDEAQEILDDSDIKFTSVTSPEGCYIEFTNVFLYKAAIEVLKSNEIQFTEVSN